MHAYKWKSLHDFISVFFLPATIPLRITKKKMAMIWPQNPPDVGSMSWCSSCSARTVAGKLRAKHKKSKTHRKGFNNIKDESNVKLKSEKDKRGKKKNIEQKLNDDPLYHQNSLKYTRASSPAYIRFISFNDNVQTYSTYIELCCLTFIT